MAFVGHCRFQQSSNSRHACHPLILLPPSRLSLKRASLTDFLLRFPRIASIRSKNGNCCLKRSELILNDSSACLGRSQQSLVDELFAPLRAVEQKMGVTEKVFPKRVFTLDQVDFLNRSQHYPEWRQVVADIFSRLNPLLDEEIVRAGRPRLVIVTCPAELPVGPDRMWMRFKKQGKMIRLDPGTGDPEDFLAQLLTGAKRSAQQKTLPELYAAQKATSPHDAWIVDAGDAVSALAVTSPTGLVKLSYEALQRYRTRLMTQVDQLLKDPGHSWPAAARRQAEATARPPHGK